MENSMPKAIPAHAVNMAARSRLLIVQDIVKLTVIPDGISINKGWVATSVVTAVSGISDVTAFWNATTICARNAFAAGELSPQRRLTTLRLRLMGVPMMIRTSKACAGLVTERKPGVNVSSDINSHLDDDREGAGSNPWRRRPKGPPPNLFSHRRRLENFFWGPPSND